MHKRKHPRSFVDAILHVSYTSFLLFWVGCTLVFALLYLLLSYVPGEGPAPIIGSWLSRFWQSLYFSIFMATSTGLGDILPFGFSRVLASAQNIISILSLAVFVGKVTSRRNDAIMEHVHALSFGVAFNDIRHGLFVARKDIDILLRKIRTEGSLTSKDWMNFHIALRQIQIFIRSIPNFYNARKHTEIVLDGQEALLFDSVERTLGRVVEAIDVFKKASYAIQNNNEDCTKELHNLVDLVDVVFPPTERYVLDAANTGILNEITASNKKIRTLLKK